MRTRLKRPRLLSLNRETENNLLRGGALDHNFRRRPQAMGENWRGGAKPSNIHSEAPKKYDELHVNNHLFSGG
jgi:hypothetical protein